MPQRQEALTELREAVSTAAGEDGSVPGLAIAFEALGQSLAGRAEPRTATVLLAAAARSRAQLGSVVHPVERAAHEAAIARARDADEAFEAHWEEGTTMGRADLIALALSR